MSLLSIILIASLSLGSSFQNSFDKTQESKEVIMSDAICVDGTHWSHSGLGTLCLQDGMLCLKYPNVTHQRPMGSSDDPDYATYGYSSISFLLGGTNWEKYNRIAFKVYPECKGEYVVNIDLSFSNGSSVRKSGYLEPTGSHLINLKRGEWNECFLEITDLQRDSVVSISISTSVRGKAFREMGDSTILFFKDFEIQKIKSPEVSYGWEVRRGDISYSMTGYYTHGIKRAITRYRFFGPRRFRICDEKGEVVYKGRIKRVKNELGKFALIDFSSLSTAGEYTIAYGSLSTQKFVIADDLWSDTDSKILEFLFRQRCGDYVPGCHDVCHSDLFAMHNGRRIAFSGGWHDAGDLSQQTLQTADVSFSLLEAYINTDDSLLKKKLYDEMMHGYDFVLKCRFGDGYRASSMGLIHWTDGVVGTYDDIYTVRVQNHAYDNFLSAGYEASAALVLNNKELRKASISDFDFALTKFKRDGYDLFTQPYEHTYSTSKSLYQATICWSAVQLFNLTGDYKYVEIATESIEYVLKCQHREPLPGGVNGFFYRDSSKSSITHFIHQSRDEMYARALVGLCKVLPHHKDFQKWSEALVCYGGYLKSLMQFTFPYGMIPSGVYHIYEPKDKSGFYALHIFAPIDAEIQYSEQIQSGVMIDSCFYVRRFPIWFNIFNGNSAVHLATGKAAAICGNYLKDEALLEIGREQLYWTVGKNPFCQSLIYGEGHNYPSMNDFCSGIAIGQMPVGIRSLNNDDIPYWPLINNACYKEAWVTTAGKFISLTAEY